MRGGGRGGNGELYKTVSPYGLGKAGRYLLYLRRLKGGYNVW